MKKFIIALLLTGFVSSHSVNDLWLLPEKFMYEPGEPVNICLKTGDHFEGVNWDGDTSDISKLDFYFTEVRDDLIGAMGCRRGDSIQLSVFDESTAMVTFKSKNSFSSQEAVYFNTSLQDQALNEVYDYRSVHNETDSTGYEYSQWNIKTIFQVGTQLTNTFKQQTDLPIDIILQENPYSFKDTGMLDVRIYFQNEVLKNALVKIWHRQSDTTSIQVLQTNEEGEIRFLLQPSGKWMLTCVKMIKNKDEDDTGSAAMAWQSYRGTCTWGYE